MLSHCVIYDMKWSSFPCLCELSNSFLSLGQLPTSYSLYFQWREISESSCHVKFLLTSLFLGHTFILFIINALFICYFHQVLCVPSLSKSDNTNISMSAIFVCNSIYIQYKCFAFNVITFCLLAAFSSLLANFFFWSSNFVKCHVSLSMWIEYEMHSNQSPTAFRRRDVIGHRSWYSWCSLYNYSWTDVLRMKFIFYGIACS